jgi:hypothetical protein
LTAAPLKQQGGVAVRSDNWVISIFTMSGGKISGDEADLFGGGVLLGGKNVSLNISGTKADSWGGGIHLVDGSKCNMYGGTVSDNYSDGYGGGISVFSGVFTRHGGTIYGSNADDGLRNTACVNLGAVLCKNYGSATENTIPSP